MLRNKILKLFLIFIILLSSFVFTNKNIFAEDEEQTEYIQPFTITLNKNYIGYGDQRGEWIAYNNSPDDVYTWIVWYCDGYEMSYTDKFVGGHSYTYLLYAKPTGDKVFDPNIANQGQQNASKWHLPNFDDITWELTASGGTGWGCPYFCSDDFTLCIWGSKYEWDAYLDTVNIYDKSDIISSNYNSNHTLASVALDLNKMPYSDSVSCIDYKVYSIDMDSYTASVNDPWKEISKTTDISNEYDKYYRFDFYFESKPHTTHLSENYVITRYTKILFHNIGGGTIDCFTGGCVSSVLITNTKRAVKYISKIEIPFTYDAASYNIDFDNAKFYAGNKTYNGFDVINYITNRTTKAMVDDSHKKYNVNYSITIIDYDYLKLADNVRVYLGGKEAKSTVSSDGRTVTITYETPSVYVNLKEQTSGREETIDLDNEKNNKELDKSLEEQKADSTQIDIKQEEQLIGNGFTPDIKLVKSTANKIDNKFTSFIKMHTEAIIVGGGCVGLYVISIIIKKIIKKLKK